MTGRKRFIAAIAAEAKRDDAPTLPWSRQARAAKRAAAGDGKAA
ncbi:MAG: hypothetical protein ACU0CO_09100 [Shimia sp.]